ncbi:MAG: hypothetical protein OXE41_05215 [Gammaproteobacteria bacterium]|nr:hypothetical protein [Gammaproteobacteria bacterium]
MSSSTVIPYGKTLVITEQATPEQMLAWDLALGVDLLAPIYKFLSMVKWNNTCIDYVKITQS